MRLPFSSIYAYNLTQEHIRLPWRLPHQDRACFGFLRPKPFPFQQLSHFPSCLYFAIPSNCSISPNYFSCTLAAEDMPPHERQGRRPRPPTIRPRPLPEYREVTASATFQIIQRSNCMRHVSVYRKVMTCAKFCVQRDNRFRHFFLNTDY